MWALRRASLSLRIQGFSIRASCAAFLDLELPITCIRNEAGVFDSPDLESDQCPSLKGFYRGKHASTTPLLVRRSLSSQTGAESSGEEDGFKDWFSAVEKGVRAKAAENSNAENGDELFAESDLSEDDGDAELLEFEMERLDVDGDLCEKMPSGNRDVPALFEAIKAAPGLSIHSALDKWVEEGNDLDRRDVSLTMHLLHKVQIYGRALQFSRWLEANKHYEFVESDYARRVDLIARLYGIKKASNSTENIPESFRGELIYRTILANYVRVNNVKKAEEAFEMMRDLGFPVTVNACNYLLLLYERNHKQRMEDVLLLMEKENVKPSLLTYKVLIDVKGKFNDITGMEQILESMKAEGIDPDNHTQFILARHYASAGLKEKAKAVLKAMEGGNINENRWVRKNLLQIYAELRDADEVQRIWKTCEPNPWAGECIAAIEAWGKLGKIKEAEAVFETMLEFTKKPSSVHFIPLLKVYANHKMLAKGKELVKLMADIGCNIGPQTWDLLVKLYVDAGKMDKADDLLQKAAQQHTRMKPMMRSYMVIMDQYSRRGDVHNTEKIFHRIKEAGYAAGLPQFQTLVQAYVNAKVPAYGMRDRMRADNFVPNRAVAEQLAQIDAFRKTAVSDLFDEGIL